MYLPGLARVPLPLAMLTVNRRSPGLHPRPAGKTSGHEFKLDDGPGESRDAVAESAGGEPPALFTIGATRAADGFTDVGLAHVRGDEGGGAAVDRRNGLRLGPTQIVTSAPAARNPVAIPRPITGAAGDDDHLAREVRGRARLEGAGFRHAG